VPAPDRLACARRRLEIIRVAAVLSALGVWTIVVPYLGRTLGLEVNVARRVELVDHVVPGAVVAGVGAYLAVRAAHRAASGWPMIAGGSACFLAGFWVLATHVPLVADAAAGRAAWGAALWHASTAVPIVALSLWLVLQPSFSDER